MLEQRPSPPTANRVVVLAIITAVLTLGLQLVLISIGLDRGNPIRLFATPVTGAAIMYFGLSGYPAWGRVRLAGMVGVLLLLFASVA